MTVVDTAAVAASQPGQDLDPSLAQSHRLQDPVNHGSQRYFGAFTGICLSGLIDNERLNLCSIADIHVRLLCKRHHESFGSAKRKEGKQVPL